MSPEGLWDPVVVLLLELAGELAFEVAAEGPHDEFHNYVGLENRLLLKECSLHLIIYFK